MSLDFGALLAGASLVQSQWQTRASIEWARILDNPVSITLLRNSGRVEEQTVRIEWYDPYTSTDGASGASTMRRAEVYGVRGHPDLDDLDIKVWDTFTFEDAEYTVVSVNRRLVGVIQATCEVVG